MDTSWSAVLWYLFWQVLILEVERKKLRVAYYLKATHSVPLSQLSKWFCLQIFIQKAGRYWIGAFHYLTVTLHFYRYQLGIN